MKRLFSNYRFPVVLVVLLAVAGTVPAIPNCWIDGGLLRWDSDSNFVYTVEYTTDLTTNWHTLSIGTNATPPMNTFPVPDDDAGFFKVKGTDDIKGFPGWELVNNLTGQVTTNNQLRLEVVGGDPYMVNDEVQIDASVIDKLHVKMRNNTADVFADLFFFRADAPGQYKTIRFGIVPNDAIHREYEIDLSASPDWHGTVTMLRLDPVADAVSGSVEMDFIRLLDTRKYLVFEMNNIQLWDHDRAIGDLVSELGTNNPASDRMVAFGMHEVPLLTRSVESLGNLVDFAFDLAEDHDVPVYFHIDPMYGFGMENCPAGEEPTLQFWDHLEMCEWVNFPTGGETHGQIPRCWVNWGSWVKLSNALPNFESPELQQFYVSQLRDGVLQPIKERLIALEHAGKGYLFAGINIGWETRFQDKSDVYGQAITNAFNPSEVMYLWEQAKTGYASLYARGWDDASLATEAAARGISTDGLFYELSAESVHSNMQMLAKTVYDYDFFRDQIFSHIVPMESYYSDKMISRVEHVAGTASAYLVADFGSALAGEEWTLSFSQLRTGTGLGDGWSGFSVGTATPPNTPNVDGFGFTMEGLGNWTAYNGATVVGSGYMGYATAHAKYEIVATFGEPAGTVSLNYTDDASGTVNLGTFTTSFGAASERFVGFRNRANSMTFGKYADVYTDNVRIETVGNGTLVFNDTFNGGASSWGDLNANLVARQAAGTVASTYTLAETGSSANDSVVYSQINNYVETPPIWTVINDYCTPGFTLDEHGAAVYDLAEMENVFTAHGREFKYGAVETYMLHYQTEAEYAAQLDEYFSTGTTLISVLGAVYAPYHGSPSPFNMNPGQANAIRDWLDD